MEIHRPGAQPLTQEERQLFNTARARLHHKVVSGGLSQDDVRAIVSSLRNHPATSYAVLNLLFDEVRLLPEGQRLLRFDD